MSNGPLTNVIRVSGVPKATRPRNNSVHIIKWLITDVLFWSCPNEMVWKKCSDHFSGKMSIICHLQIFKLSLLMLKFVTFSSLQHLPYVPSLSFLRQEILVGPKMYFQIVGTMLLHKKVLSQTEKRHAIYNFPGFCSGCLRMGLCYGCERSSQMQ